MIKKLAIYSNGKRKIRTDFVKVSEGFPLTLFVNNELFNYEKSFLAGTKSYQESLVKNLEEINIINPFDN
jgi:hypothetical protein